MYSLDPVQHVLSIDEILELILEYAACREIWYNSSKLRLVCKKWRSLAFRGLRQSKTLQNVFIGDGDGGSYRNVFPTMITPEGFSKWCKSICSANLTLTQTLLPIQVLIRRPPTKDDVKFLKEHSFLIARVIVHLFSDGDETKFAKAPEPQLNFNLVNLRKLTAAWDYGDYNKSIQRLVAHLLDTSKRLSVIKFKYYLGEPNVVFVSIHDSTATATTNFPLPPPSLTHVEVTGSTENLGKIIDGDFKRLRGISLNLPCNTSEADWGNCSSLTQTVERHSLKLEKLKLRNEEGLQLSGSFQLPRLKNLELLKCDIPFSVNGDDSCTQHLPVLKTLQYVHGNTKTMDSTAIKWSLLNLPNLKASKLIWRNAEFGGDFGHQRFMSQRDKMYEDNFINEVEKYGLPNYPEMHTFSVKMLPYRVGMAVIPKVFLSLTNITSLCLSLKRSIGGNRLHNDDTNNMLKILTGMDSNDIPKDENLWPGLLRNKTDAITNLKNLENLEIETCKRCFLGKFIFRAAFFQLPKLKLIDTEGGVLVDHEMEKEWESSEKRSLILSEAAWHIEDRNNFIFDPAHPAARLDLDSDSDSNSGSDSDSSSGSDSDSSSGSDSDSSSGSDSDSSSGSDSDSSSDSDSDSSSDID